MADTLVSKFQTVATTSGTYDIVDYGDWITTVLSFTVCNTDTDNGTFSVYLDDGDSANNYYIYTEQSLPAGATFEHTDKIILNADDRLRLVGSSNSPYPSYAITGSSLKQTS